jgi:ABC-type branched-subunit amino acid transport system substrate-binding protein
LKRKQLLIVLLVVLGLVAASCGRDDKDSTGNDAAGGTSTTAAAANDKCASEKPEATDIGVTADKITVETMADVGSSLAPGLFQGNHDGMEAFAKYVNANGGIACRDLEVKLWDSKLNPDESKNGIIDACANAVAMVGGNALFNPDVSAMTGCKDKAGAATGLPDVAALANDINEQCAPTAFLIQGVAEGCKVLTGERDLTAFTGPTKFYLQQGGGSLHGLFLVPGDLPTTVQSATYQIKAQEDAGVKWDAVLKVSGRDEQAAFTPKVQQIKANKSNYVYMGSNDTAMVNMMKEAKAQGVDTVKVWSCSLACYTPKFLKNGGADIEGTYVWMQFLPFEEASSNEALKAYVDNVGGMSKVDSFGAQAWQAGMLFKHVVDKIVESDGVNGVTRAKILETLKTTDDFTADGWMGSQGKDLRGFSTCFLVMQVEGGKFVRKFPEKVGTLECDNDAKVVVHLDPAKEAESIK